MEHLSSDEVRQRFIQYFKELEAGQGHKQVLSEYHLLEDQTLPIMTAIIGIKTDSEMLMFSMNPEIIDVITDWFLLFSDIEKIRQEFDQYYGGRPTNRKYFLLKIIDALKDSNILRKKQFLDITCKEMQIKRTPDIELNQKLKKEFDERIENRKPILGEFIFKLYQNRYIQLKQAGNPEETNVQLVKNFSDREESYISQRTDFQDLLSAIRFILLKELEITQEIEQNVKNNIPISNQSYYDCVNIQSESKKKTLFNKLSNNNQFFIDIIIRAISKNSFRFNRDNDEKSLIHHIELTLQKERKDFIAAYILKNPENIIDFLKECNFISATNRGFERDLADKKLTHGELFLKLYEQKFFIDPLKKIAEEKEISFDEEGFHQIRKDKEQETRKHILELANHAIAIAFLLADGVTPSNEGQGYILSDLTSQAKEALSQLNLGFHTHPMPSNNLVSLIKTVIETVDYPQFKERHQYIINVAHRLRQGIMEGEKIEKKQQQEKREEMKQQEPKDILIKTIRIKNFRGLENIEIDLEKTTVLTGANNTGKSSVLHALQLVFGSHQFISQDDFFIKGDSSTSQEIIIDTLIVPVDDQGNICDNFTDDWISVFTQDRIKPDPNDPNKNHVPFRTKIKFDPLTNNFQKKQFAINGWSKFKEKNTNWFDKDNGDEISFYFDEIPFFYIDAQRDILKDIKLKNSYLGKMISKIEYSEADIKAIEEQIKSLNDTAIDGSAILLNIKTVLEEINSTMSTDEASIEITPFTKKIRDLNKGLSIYYADQKNSFSMEYHGMGTRSWSSLLTLKAFISSLTKNSQKEGKVFFPILAIEEPEAHLHPNAQKQLYHQINSIEGQKVISTHSPYVAAKTEIKQIRGLYKKERVTCGKVTKLSPEDESKIKTHVMSTHGEIIFSKFIVFSEGQTESQALPVFAEKSFGKHPSDIGLNFVGVAGNGAYFPFIQFATSLNIPWLIFSDADQGTPKKVKKQISKTGIKEADQDKFVVFLDEGKKFEEHIADNFEDQIRKAHLSLIDNKQYQIKEKEKNQRL